MLYAALIAVASLYLGRLVPLLGAPLFGILIGASLSLNEVFAVGSSSFAVMIGTLAVAFAASVIIGRWLGIPAKLTVLIGAGTGICGGSAIAAVSPISLALAGVMTLRTRKAALPEPQERPRVSFVRVFPWFILGFLATSLVNTLHLLPAAILRDATEAGRFLIVMALAAVGPNADLRRMVSAGFRPILLELGVWASVAVSSLVIQHLVG